MITLAADKTRCLAHGMWPGKCYANPKDRKPDWCESRDECARHVAIRTDPQDGTRTVHPRLCKAGEFDQLIPIE